MIDMIENGYENGILTFERCYSDSDKAAAIADQIEEKEAEIQELAETIEQCKNMTEEEAIEYFGCNSKREFIADMTADIRCSQKALDSLIEELEAQREADTLAEMPGYGTEWN